MIDFVVEIGPQINCWRGLGLVAVESAGCSAQKHQIYSAAVGVGSDFDLVAGH